VIEDQDPGSVASAINDVALDVDHQLDPAVVSLWRARGVIASGVLALVAGLSLTVMYWLGASVVSRLAVGIVLGIVTLTRLWKAISWPRVAYEHAAFRLSIDGVLIRKGVYWRSVAHVPRSRIQHTDVAQGPLERRHNLATLIMHTAGTSNAEIKLAGLKAELAYRMRDALLPSGQHDGV
jgi:membrane protein YdbS with pleckstrin-like domain